MNTPELLSRRQLAGLLRIGDILIPGDAQLPSFSASQCARQADRMLRYMTDHDRNGVRLVLGLFGVLPRFLVRAIYWLTDQHRAVPELAAAPLRVANLGIKGVVMTLYYSDVGEGTSVYECLRWDPRVVERDAASEAAPPEGAPASPEGGVQPLSAPAPPPAAVLAFTRARNGRRSLRRLTVADRLRFLSDLKQVILTRREAIIDRIQQDTGKSRSDALISEIFAALDNLAWLERHAAKCLRDRKQHTPIALMGKISWTWYEPLGTILIISPWNYPFYQAIVPIAAAFAAGNTVVYKPSEWTPLEGLIEELLAEAQFAPNWVQIVYGDGRVGVELIEQKPDKIFCTGSTRTGRQVLAQAAPHLVPVELELGGKDAMIVFDDVNIERAAAGAAWGALTNTGQSCTSVERVYVHQSIYDSFRAALIKEVERLTQEIDRDGDADLGAMTTDVQVQIVARHLEDAKAKGAVVLTGESWDGKSKLIPPIVIDNVTQDMLVAREETFGPVIPLLAFTHEEEVIQLANDSEYGLTASVWTKDRERGKRVSRALEVGGVSINNVMATEANPALPFGGVKHSGFGRHKGEHGLHAFCNVKSVLVDEDSGKIEANWYPYTKEKYRIFSELTVNLFSGGLRPFIRFVLTGMKLERYSKRAHKRGRG